MPTSYAPIPRLKSTTDYVDAHGENGNVEDEAQDAVNQGHPSHMARRDGYVGNLGRHTDDKGVIGKVEIIRRIVSRETPALRRIARIAVLGIGASRVVEREQGLDDQPGHDERGDRKRQMTHPRPEREQLELAQDEADLDNACTCCGDDQQENDVASLIVQLRANARHRRIGARNRHPGQCKVGERADIPIHEQTI